MTRREFLVSKGLAKEGRGKFSTAAKDALAAAIAAGTVFDDMVETPKPVKEKSDKPAPRPTTAIAELPEYRFTEGVNVAREVESGKVRSLREVCKTLCVSLLVCPCDTHRIVATDGTGDVAVRIK